MKIFHSDRLFLCGLANQKKGGTSHGDATSHHDAMIPRDDPVSRRSKHWYDSDQVTEICHRLQPADPVANRDCSQDIATMGKTYALSVRICCIQQKEL